MNNNFDVFGLIKNGKLGKDNLIEVIFDGTTTAVI